MRKTAIIVAGGQGIRMQGTLPKQFLAISGEPVLFHTLRKFNHDSIRIILVMNEAWIDYWNDLIREFEFEVQHEVIAGGRSRAMSVLNGLNLTDDHSLVAVHDAVRPLVTETLIQELYNQAVTHKAVIPVVPVKDSLRIVDGNSSKAVARDNFRAVQTPQVFHASLLKEAFKQEGYENFTDEASLVEANGQAIYLVPGEDSNIKITVPADLVFAEAMLLKP
jgi:2-C-methyl-D-erythritol 4-phosphate cytidylyltransferase